MMATGSGTTRRPLRALAALAAAAALAAMLAAAAAPAATITWTGGAADKLWSSAGNWSGAPANQDIRFENAGTSGTAGVVTSIVDATTTINSLHFRNYADHTVDPNSNYHTVQVNNGVTLNVTSYLRVGDSGNSRTTWTRIEGAGSLNVNAPAGNIDVDYNGTYWQYHPSELDLSGLASFTANVAQLRLGPSNPYASISPYATLRLSPDSSITADAVVVSGGQHNYGYLYLNEDTTIHTDTISVAQGGYRRGYIYFASGLTDPALEIRGKVGGSSRADLLIADGASGKGTMATVDFTGGAVDALLGHVAIAVTDGGTQGWEVDADATLTLADGVIDANTVVIGQAVPTTNNGRSANGTLNINGGTFRAGTLTLGDFQAGAGAVGSYGVRATVNLAGGTLQVGTLRGGDEAGATPTRTFNWSAGTIQNAAGADATITDEVPLVLKTAGAHSFNADADRTITVESVVKDDTGAAGLTKLGDGTLRLNAANTYRGGTAINDGTLLVGHANALGTTGAIAVATGATLAVAPGVTFAQHSRVAWAAGATLGGGGVYATGGAWTVPGGVSLSPGLSIDTLTLDAGGAPVVLGPTSTLRMDLADDPDSDLLRVLGSLDLGGATLSLHGTALLGHWYTLVEATSLTGEFGAVDFSALDGVGGYDLRAEQGRLEVLLAGPQAAAEIPEPASAALLLSGVVALGLRRRRR